MRIQVASASLIENKKSWARKKLKDKQPGIEEEEDMMSRHLDAVATSTLIQKQSRHQHAREKRSRHH